MTKIQLRNAWFQIHKWIGLSLAIVIIPISATGAALVWHEPIDAWMHPARHAVSGPVALPAQAYAEAARAALAPGELLARLQFPREAGDAVTASATKPGKGRPQRVTVYLDPATAKVLDKERSGEGVFQVMHVLHGSLMVPGVGRQIVGWVGVAMLLSSLTGLWLWWPTAGSLKRALRWGRHRNFDHNLHQTLGFWISLPLFVLSLTGVWISFPQWFAGFDGPQPKGPDRAMMVRARPLEAPVTSLALAVERAQGAAPGTLRSVAWPTDQKPLWSVEVAAKGAPTTVEVQDADGTAKATPRAPGAQRQTIARLMRQIHDGQGTPFLWQLIVFLGGAIPAVLGITGLIMWWRARKWRRDLAIRKARAA